MRCHLALLCRSKTAWLVSTWPRFGGAKLPPKPRVRITLGRRDNPVGEFTGEDLTTEQLAELKASCERWRELAFSTERIERAPLASAVTNLYRELSLSEPRDFVFFDSPTAALQAYPLWKNRTGRLAQMLWDYQLPLFDPSSYWRQHSQWRNLDLAIRRKPNIHGCYAFGEALPGDGRVLTRREHAQIWNTVLRCLDQPDWCAEAVESLEENVSMAELADRVAAEDSTSQAWPLDFLTLGPKGWFLREVAAVHFARNTLGCRVNDGLLDAQLGILRHGSLLLTFERLVIGIERPVRFESGQPCFTPV
jgi:hypothetical protein